MLKRVVVTNYLGESVEYKIDGVQTDGANTSGLIITSIDGLGPVKANVNMTELTTTDGGIFNSARLSTRNIVIKALFIHATSIEEARLLSYKFFPIKKKVTLRIETDNRIAETTGYVESNEPDIFSDKSGCQISILCESPFFVDKSQNGKIVDNFSSSEPIFEFPFEVWNSYDGGTRTTYISQTTMDDLKAWNPGVATFVENYQYEPTGGALPEDDEEELDEDGNPINPSTPHYETKAIYSGPGWYGNKWYSDKKDNIELWPYPFVSPNIDDGEVTAMTVVTNSIDPECNIRSYVSGTSGIYGESSNQNVYFITGKFLSQWEEIHVNSTFSSGFYALGSSGGGIAYIEIVNDMTGNVIHTMRSDVDYGSDHVISGLEIGGHYTIRVRIPKGVQIATGRGANMYGIKPVAINVSEYIPAQYVEIGEFILHRETNIVYTGDVEIGFKLSIRVNENTENIRVYNVASEEVMRLDTDKLSTIPGVGGTNFIRGDEIIIDTRQGNKSIQLLRNGNSYNILNVLDRGSTWLKLYCGNNIFAYIADSGESTLQISISADKIFEGV